MIRIVQESGLKIKLQNKRTIYLWLREIAKEYGFFIENISIVLVSDEKLLEINTNFLSHNYYTDIITFDYSAEKKINAELFISIDRVAENAANYKITTIQELNRVMAHGVLHCMRFKDKSKQDQIKMKQAENRAIELLQSS